MSRAKLRKWKTSSYCVSSVVELDLARGLTVLAPNRSGRAYRQALTIVNLVFGQCGDVDLHPISRVRTKTIMGG